MKTVLLFLIVITSFFSESLVAREGKSEPNVKQWVADEVAVLNTQISGKYRYILIEKNSNATHVLDHQAITIDCMGRMGLGDARVYPDVATAANAASWKIRYDDDSRRILTAGPTNGQKREDFCNYIKKLADDLASHSFSSLVLEIKDEWLIINAYGVR